ncbi:MAG: hypothetical protein R3A11_00385 [Bdellovibrionota bacterium]
MPLHWFEGSVLPTNASQVCRWYEKVFFVRSWKDKLPEGATILGQGFAKATLIDRSHSYLERYRSECLRGERAHWTMIGSTGIFVLWNPLWAILVMVGYALVSNLPCIISLHYNRLRMGRLLKKYSKIK